jgi:hypothetical protein
MKKIVAACALLACAATALAQQGGKPDRPDIDVTVVGGKTTVVEEVARTTDSHGAVVWKVQQGYRFADEGIVIEAKGKDKFNCEARGNGSKFRCAKLAHIKGDRYKYVVNLIDEKTGRPLAPLDPFIQND